MVTRAVADTADQSAIDGEIVALDADGKPSFGLLQSSSATPVVFYVFDLLMVRGRDLRQCPLEERREHLREIVNGSPEINRYSETFAAPAAALIQVVRENGLEGIVAMRAGSIYRSGRSERSAQVAVEPRPGVRDRWLCAGFEHIRFAPRGLLRRLGAYVRRARSSWSGAGPRQALFPHFAKLRVEDCPFRGLPERTKGRWGEGLTAVDMRKCRWPAPRLVAAVEFLEWTPQLRLRHPRFVGLRTDKDPNKVIRE
jgi:ATP-dependent DNA ligase